MREKRFPVFPASSSQRPRYLLLALRFDPRDHGARGRGVEIIAGEAAVPLTRRWNAVCRARSQRTHALPRGLTQSGPSGADTRNSLHSLSLRYYKLATAFLSCCVCSYTTGMCKSERSTDSDLRSVVTRGTVVGYLTIVVGFLTIGMLIWQNCLIREQIAQRSLADQLARRTELISILYDYRDVGGRKVARANSRTRSEALVEFVELERARITSERAGGPDVGSARLNRVILNRANLEDVRVDQFDARDVDFSEASLKGGVFPHGNFSGANFVRADLSRANFSACDMTDALMRGADTNGAVFAKATLNGVWSIGEVARGQGMNLSKAILELADTDRQAPGSEEARAALRQRINQILVSGFVVNFPMKLSKGLHQPPERRP